MRATTVVGRGEIPMMQYPIAVCSVIYILVEVLDDEEE